jgi:hypothetical protein
LEIDYELETRQLLDRELGRVCAFEDFIDEGSGGAELLDQAERI